MDEKARYWADKAEKHAARARKHSIIALRTLFPDEAMKIRKLAAKNFALAERAKQRSES